MSKKLTSHQPGKKSLSYLARFLVLGMILGVIVSINFLTIIITLLRSPPETHNNRFQAPVATAPSSPAPSSILLPILLLILLLFYVYKELKKGSIIDDMLEKLSEGNA